MLYGLYAGTFFYNVLFYIRMLQAVPEGALLAANTGYLCLCAVGALAYGFAHERVSAGLRARLLYSSLGVSALGGGWLWLGIGDWGLAVMMMALSYGYVTGHIAYKAARLVPLGRQGRFIGGSLGLCNLALYFALYLPLHYQLLPLLGAILLTGVLLYRLEGAQLPVPKDELGAEAKAVLGGNLPLAVMIALSLGLLVGLDDSVFLPRFMDYEETFGTSRLFSAGGYLLAGLVADVLPLYLPVIAIAAKAVPLFVRAGSDSLVLTLLSYMDAFFTGALIILVIRLFFTLAPLTGRPRLWAGMGRAIELSASALGACFGVVYLGGQSLSLIVACHTALLLGCAALFYRGLMIFVRAGSFTAASAEAVKFRLSDGINCLAEPDLALAAPGETPLWGMGRNLQQLQQEYGFTDREMEVLGEALQSKSIADIAQDLCVTERTVKFHISNLLKKTGCHNQKELREKLQ